MRTQYAVRTRPSYRIKQFIKTSFEPATTKQGEEAKPGSLPVFHAKPVVKEPASNDLPLFMEPLFKAKDFDPL